MPRRFFKNFAPKRRERGESRLPAPFGDWFRDPRLWAIRRRTVAPAFALGLFLAFLPFPGHPIFAALLALALRINVPVAAVTTFANNPLTVAPMFYAAYSLGSYLLGTPDAPFEFEWSLDWLSQTFVHIWQPLTLGCAALGSITGVIGFVVVDLLWRLSLRDYKLNKRRNRKP